MGTGNQVKAWNMLTANISAIPAVVQRVVHSRFSCCHLWLFRQKSEKTRVHQGPSRQWQCHGAGSLKFPFKRNQVTVAESRSEIQILSEKIDTVIDTVEKFSSTFAVTLPYFTNWQDDIDGSKSLAESLVWSLWVKPKRRRMDNSKTTTSLVLWMRRVLCLRFIITIIFTRYRSCWHTAVSTQTRTKIQTKLLRFLMVNPRRMQNIERKT